MAGPQLGFKTCTVCTIGLLMFIGYSFCDTAEAQDCKCRKCRAPSTESKFQLLCKSIKAIAFPSWSVSRSQNHSHGLMYIVLCRSYMIHMSSYVIWFDFSDFSSWSWLKHPEACIFQKEMWTINCLGCLASRTSNNFKDQRDIKNQTSFLISKYF